MRMRRLGMYLLLLLPVFFLIRVYGLGRIFFIPLFAAFCLAFRKLGKYRMLDREYENTYLQVTTYLEQLICSYRRLGHAGKALEDCRILFEEGSPMGAAIGRARHILLTGEGVVDGNILSAAFAEMEAQFDSRRMRIIHRFICNSERTGAESGRSADILLEDLELWKNRTKIYQSRKRFIKIECGIATVLSLILCYVSKLLTPQEMGFDLSDSLLYQISTAGVFFLFLFIFVMIYKKMSGSWLDGREAAERAEGERRERLYRIINGEKKRASALTGHMAKKILAKYVRNEFPYWLLLVTLYLQSESSYQALRYSIGETDGVFRLELERMVGEIYDSPRSLEPYLGFFAALAIPEVQSGMKILYSVNANGYEDSKKQLDFLVAQNNRLMDKNESYHHSNLMAGMSLLKQLPMVVSCFKLLIDLVNLLAITMGSFQNMNV